MDHERLPDAQILVRLILARNRRTPGFAQSILQGLTRLLPHEPKREHEPAPTDVDEVIDVASLIG